MCFSATASFATGAALTLIGKSTIHHTKRKRELPFASVPLLLGIQQVTEGVVWLTFNSYPFVHTFATHTYAVFSQVWWPIYFPISLLLLEKNPERKKMMIVTAAVGFFIGLFLLYIILTSSVRSVIHNNSIGYYSSYSYTWIVGGLYTLAVCGSALASSYKIINQFGIMLFISLIVSKLFFDATFFSVWCFFAAILSVFVYMYISSTTHTLHMNKSIKSSA